jgi:hypothetical protein
MLGLLRETRGNGESDEMLLEIAKECGLALVPAVPTLKLGARYRTGAVEWILESMQADGGALTVRLRPAGSPPVPVGEQ